MPTRSIAGPGAGVYKYDLLTALSVGALHGSVVQQTSALRLIAMITARYNWQRDEVSIGQCELARLWGVNERTVKREMKRLTDAGILICLRPGVRGRVGAYRVSYEGVERLSRPVWAAVGADFERRFEGHGATAPKVVRVDFGARSPSAPPDETPPDSWGAVQARLRAEFPDAWGNWFRQLGCNGVEAGAVQLTAPSGFVCRYVETHLRPPLLVAIRAEFGPAAEVSLKPL